MKTMIRCFGAVLAVWGFSAFTGELPAADPSATTITIPDLECAGCAKKVSTKLSAVAKGAKVQVDVQTKTATVTPPARTVLSPRALWDAVEQAEKTPSKLQGPSGTFTAKPKS